MTREYYNKVRNTLPRGGGFWNRAQIWQAAFQDAGVEAVIVLEVIEQHGKLWANVRVLTANGWTLRRIPEPKTFPVFPGRRKLAAE